MPSLFCFCLGRGEGAGRKTRERRSNRGRFNAKYKTGSLQKLEARDLLARVTWAVEDGGNGHQYEYVSTEVNFLEARALANSMGGHLVTISSPAEGAFLRTLDKQLGFPWAGAFGGPGLFQDEHWEWVTGELIVFQDWLSSEPNNFGLETAVSLWGIDGEWNDVHMATRNSFIVEYDGLRDRGLSDGLHATNDAPSMATDLGAVSELTVVQGSLRAIADIDWYQFKAQASGMFTVRVPATPNPKSTHFSLGNSKNGTLLQELYRPSYSQFRFQVEAGQTYRFSYGNWQLDKELPYEMLLAPPGTVLPAPSLDLPGVRQSIEDVQGTLLDGQSVYYGVTDLRRADIRADVHVDPNQGTVRAELVDPLGTVLAAGVATETGVKLEYRHIQDLFHGYDPNAKSWPIYLKLTAVGDVQRYTLNASAKALGSDDASLVHDLGTVDAGLEVSLTMQTSKVFKFTPARTGPLHVLFSSELSVGQINLLNSKGQIVATSRYQPIVGVRLTYLLSFMAEAGEVYSLGATVLRWGLTGGQIPIRIMYSGDPLAETEPNDLIEQVNRLGRRSNWVIQARAAESMGRDVDNIEVTAARSGGLFVGATSVARGDVTVFVNGRLASSPPGTGVPTVFVKEGDTIRFEVSTMQSEDYKIYGFINPMLPTDDPYEYNELLGLASKLAVDRFWPGRSALLHSPRDSDVFEYSPLLGVYTAALNTSSPAGYRLEVFDATTAELVATGAPSADGLSASFVSFNRPYKLVVSAQAENFTPAPYQVRVSRVSGFRFMQKTVSGAEMEFLPSTTMMGGFSVGFVGHVDIQFKSANSNEPLAGTLRVGLRDSSGKLDVFSFNSTSAPVRLPVVRGQYVLGIMTDTPQNILAKVDFVRTPGDADGDGLVSVDDFTMLRANFGQLVSHFALADLNGDRKVDIQDFAILRRNFNRPAR